VPKARLVWNPVARRLAASQVEAAVADLRAAGWEIDLRRTESPQHATALAQEAAKAGFDVVAACGGDGTVNEVINGLAGSPTALAVIPGGTANVWAKEVGLPKDPRHATRLIVEGERRTIDVGVAGDRRFLLMAGVGFDAYVVNCVPPALKRRLGAASYLLQGLRELLRYRSAAQTLRLDGRDLATPVFWLVLGNTRSYGGVVRITNRSLVDDGLLDLCVFQEAGVARFARYGLRILAGRHGGSPGTIWERVRTLEVDGPALPVQVDGEPAGSTPMRFRVEPGAVHVIVPAGCRSPLFSRPRRQ